MRSRFEIENAEALAEVAEEQRRIRANRKKNGVPDRMFVPNSSTGVIVCRRGAGKPFPRT